MAEDQGFSGMSEEIVELKETRGTKWQVTTSLRWYATGFGLEKKLQQMSFCQDTGEEEWNDVPTVYGR